MPAGVIPAEPITAEQKLVTVDAVLKSRAFHRAPKLREFFRLICERSLSATEAEPLREQEIGRAVYQRSDDYNSAEDNIVRVEARNLRRKLGEFFADEGKDLAIIITIPRGAYAPQFERRALVEPESAAPLVEEAEAAAPAIRPEPARRFPTPLGAKLLIAALAVLSAGLLWWNASLRSAIPETRLPAIWSALFDEQHETYLVLADSGYATVQDLLQKRLTLSDYIRRDHETVFHAADPANPREQAAEIIGVPHLTSVTGARFVGRVASLPGILRNRLNIRYSREIEPRDLKANHVILVGSARSNPWVEVFLPKLNFQQDFDFSQSRAIIRNKAPLPGELPLYRAGAPVDGAIDLYATLALLPNLDGNGNVLIVGGTRMEGTEAASDLLFNAALTEQMIRQLHLLKDGHLQYFEVLLKSSRLGSTARGFEVVAHRIIPK